MSAVALWHPTPRRVAVFRALNLGDLLCTVPAFRSLRHALPSARITLIGLDSMRPLVQRYGHYINDVVAFPGHPAFPEQTANLSALPNFYRDMRNEKFDLALQMHGSGANSNSIVHALGATQWAGFVPEKFQQTPCLMAWPHKRQEIQRYLDLLEYLGLPTQGAEMEFPLSESDHTKAHELAAQVHINLTKTIFIHPGARLASRRWPVERFVDVGRRLTLAGWQIAVTGGQTERSLTSGLAAAIGRPVIDLGGRTELGVLASLLKHGRLLICNDTGVSHIAAAVGVPSVVIACGSDAVRWAPPEAHLHTVLYANTPCRPCAYDHCPVGHTCALAINSTQVINAALAQLTKGPKHV